MALTIGQTIGRLHHSLREYIEATYHISDPSLVEQRGEILGQLGVIHQRPYIESTPRYQQGDSFAQLGLPQPVLEMFDLVAHLCFVIIHPGPPWRKIEGCGGLIRLVH